MQGYRSGNSSVIKGLLTLLFALLSLILLILIGYRFVRMGTQGAELRTMKADTREILSRIKDEVPSAKNVTIDDSDKFTLDLLRSHETTVQTLIDEKTRKLEDLLKQEKANQDKKQQLNEDIKRFSVPYQPPKP